MFDTSNAPDYSANDASSVELGGIEHSYTTCQMASCYGRVIEVLQKDFSPLSGNLCESLLARITMAVRVCRAAGQDLMGELFQGCAGIAALANSALSGLTITALLEGISDVFRHIWRAATSAFVFLLSPLISTLAWNGSTREVIVDALHYLPMSLTPAPDITEVIANHQSAALRLLLQGGASWRIGTDFNNSGNFSSDSLALSVGNVLNNSGTLSASQALAVSCGAVIGDGLIAAPQIFIRADDFSFTGTINCSGECVIFAANSIDPTAFKFEGGGKLIIVDNDPRAIDRTFSFFG